MTLGASFPPEFRRQQIARQLKPGTVIKLVKRMDDGELHEKRFVVVHVDEHTVTCIINSNVSTFLQNRPEMLRCQVSIPVANHPFMDHHSHVDCSRTRTYVTDDVVTELIQKTEWVLGSITPELRDDMIAAIKFARTLSVAEVELICQSLTEAVVP
jgi:hypothetical protein